MSDRNGLPPIKEWPKYIGNFLIGMVRSLFTRNKQS